MLEKDRKNVVHVAKLVSNVANNTYSLKRHMWNDVSEEWPFYTDHERALFRRSKPQNLTPPLSDGSSSSSIVSGLSSSSSRPASPQGISGPPVSMTSSRHHESNERSSNKRKSEQAAIGALIDGSDNPASKRKRVSKYVRPREMYGSDYGGKSPGSMLLQNSSPKRQPLHKATTSPEYYQQSSYHPSSHNSPKVIMQSFFNKFSLKSTPVK